MIDASAIAEYLLRTPRSAAVERVITAEHSDLHTPALCDIEICSALRRAVLGKRLSEARALEAVRDYLDLPLFRHGHMGLMERMLRLRHNFSPYDAAYVALAEQLQAVFVTSDDPLARAVREHFPAWEVNP